MKPFTSPRRLLVVVVFGCLVHQAVWLGSLPLAAQNAAPSAPEGRTASVVVLPFANVTGESDDEWIGAGIAESLVTDLEGQAFAVIGPERVVDVLGTLPGDELATEPHQALEVGRRVGADWLISGAYQRLGDRIRITGRFVEVVTGTVVRSAKVDGALDQLFALQDRVLAELLSGSVSEASGRGGTVAGPSPGPSSVQVPATAAAAPARAAPGAARSATSSPDVGANTSVAPGTVAEAEFSEATLTAAGFPLARARRVEDAPVVDGEVLNDPAYAEVAAATGFRQNRPDEGQPSSERTEVRIVYTDDTLYFAVVCYVTDPQTIIVADSRRDSSLRDTDSFQIILDTYLDQQNGFVFGTNPAGVEYDAQVTNEGAGLTMGSGRGGGGGSGGAGRRQQRGSGGGFNLNWDGAWQVRAQISDIGWTAEFAIPFRTLRYPTGDVQTWGVNFQRNIRTRNERAFWAPLPRQFNLNRLSFAGELQGIEVPKQRNLKLTPYLLGDTVRRTGERTTTSTGDVGADLKYSVTPSLTLDLTYNTDFAQVEVDEQRINLNRFNLFFPEKRPFFLENAGLFSVGRPGQVEIFFSRRIGIGESGEQIPILGGGRLSGKIGRNTNVGFLNLQTESVNAGGTPAQTFTVARVRQDGANRSNIGAIVVNRQTGGSLADDRDYNRTFAVDGRLGIGQGGTISGFAADTETPGAPRRDTHAYGLSANYNAERVLLNLGYSEVGPNFNPEVGFYQRRGYRRTDATVFTYFRPANFMGLHELRPHVRNNTVWNFLTGQQETQFTHIDNHWEWGNGAQVQTGMNLIKEGVFEAFEIFPGVIVPPGVYEHAQAQVVTFTNRGAPFSVGLFTTFGGFFGGDRVRLQPFVSMRVGETFNAQLRWDWNDIDLPGGAFITNLGSLRVSYSFTTRVFLQALVQYNDREDLWSSNVRLGLLSDANTGLFVVYNDVQGLGSVRPSDAGRTLTLKYSYLFDLLD